ncbi:MAG: FAD-dependent oxidoreductase [Anaerolineae bacterium]
MDYDVIVIGGGTAGVIAAIQAARAGARTLLVERNGILGGTTTAAAVSFPGIFHAWGRQVIAGIGWDLVAQTVKEAGMTLPDFSIPHLPHPCYHVPIDPNLYAALCCQAISDCSCELLLYTMLASVRRGSGSWEVELCTKTGIKSFRARVLIDCTGDANCARLAGAEIRTVADPQPATLVWDVSGYDFAALDIEALNRAFHEQVLAGNLHNTDISWDTQSADIGTWLWRQRNKTNHFLAPDAFTSEGRTALELHARCSLLRLYRFLRTQPGLHNLHIDYMAPECGIRETVTVVGEATITADDYTSGRLWDDAVCYSFYPIDLHVNAGTGLDCHPLQEGIVPTVPRGALLPRGCGNLLVAGRCLSSDRLANSALRVQATCMATGQAAGALAALCAATNTDPRDVPYLALCDLLKKHGAIVPQREPGNAA